MCGCASVLYQNPKVLLVVSQGHRRSNVPRSAPVLSLEPVSDESLDVCEITHAPIYQSGHSKMGSTFLNTAPCTKGSLLNIIRQRSFITVGNTRDSRVTLTFALGCILGSRFLRRTIVVVLGPQFISISRVLAVTSTAPNRSSCARSCGQLGKAVSPTEKRRSTNDAVTVRSHGG